MAHVYCPWIVLTLKNVQRLNTLFVMPHSIYNKYALFTTIFLGEFSVYMNVLFFIWYWSHRVFILFEQQQFYIMHRYALLLHTRILSVTYPTWITTWSMCIETETKWPPFRRRHSKMYFHEMYECWLTFLKFVLKVKINNITALVQIMAWRRPGNKPSF